MLIKALAFTCVVKAQRNKTEDEFGLENNYDDINRALPSTIPVVFDNTDGDDSCSYVEQSDGSIVISTMHGYEANHNCHKYWECDDPDHKMFFKWNRVQMRQSKDCKNGWARVAWGTKEHDQEIFCTKRNDLSFKQKSYKNTGGQGSKNTISETIHTTSEPLLLHYRL